MAEEKLCEVLKKNEVYIFGAGFIGKSCLAVLKKYDIQVKSFWDNDSSKCGKEIEGIPIMSPSYGKNAIVIIAMARYWDEVRSQLIDLGFSENEIFFPEEIEYMDVGDSDRHVVCEYPKTIQMPITYKCNFDCVMCGMQQLVKNKDISHSELREILKDKLFSKVSAVGINGGEPFLKDDLVECMEVMIETLPELKEFYMISNGFYTEKMLEKLAVIKSMCEKENKKIYLSISVDGIEDMQDFHRGRKGAFKNADRTICEIKRNEKKYVDNINVICTITKYNIARINEVVVWAENRNIKVDYNIATPNKRIDNLAKVRDFYVFEDEHSRMLATEFFYGMYVKTGLDRYFSVYLSLRYNKRFAECPYQNKEWVTLTPDGKISFCTSYSECVGSALEHSAYELFHRYSDEFCQEVKKHCGECLHNHNKINGEGKRMLMEDKLKRFYMR